MENSLTKDEKINLLKDMFVHKNLFKGYPSKNNKNNINYIDFSKLNELDTYAINKMVDIYLKNNKNPGSFNPEEIMFLNEEFFKKMRCINEEVKFFGKMFINFAFDFFDGHIRRDYEIYTLKKEMDKKYYLYDIKEMSKKLEESKLNYIKKYGSDSLEDLVVKETPKINQLKIIDMIGKPVDANYDSVYRNEKIWIQNICYTIVQFNEYSYITIDDSIKGLISNEYIEGLLKTFEYKKDYIHVKIGDDNKKTKVLTKRGLLKFVIYLNDNSINDEHMNTKINHLIELSNILTHSCN